MISSHFISNFLALDWNEQLTFSLILFSAGLICLFSAILLAIYLIKSHRFSTPSVKESLSSLKKDKELSRLSRLKNKIRSFFKRKKSPLQPSRSYNLDIESNNIIEFLPEPSKNELNSSD